MGSTRHEVIRQVRRMGFEIVSGRKHYRVIDPATGQQVAVIPLGQRAYGHGRGGVALMTTLRRHRRSKR